MHADPEEPLPPPQRRLTVVDASILINFLGLGRFDLLFVARRVAITAEVNAEIQRNRAALDAAIARGDLTVHALLMDAAETAAFARLTRRISAADASSIILAARLGGDLAVDDRAFRGEAAATVPSPLLGTEDLLADAVRTGALSLAEGDRLLGLLPALRFLPRIASLSEILPADET